MECKNCGASTIGNYCQECGQRTKLTRVSFSETFEDAADAMFTVQAPIWRTIKMLLVAPGRMLREYLGGKRKSYYKPVAFFILTTAVYLLLRSLIGFDPFQDSSITVEGQKVSTLSQAREFMLININKLLFFFVATLALFMKLFFYKRYTLAEYIAVCFYLIGMYTIITTVNMFFIQFVNSELQYFALLLMWGYFIYASISFFQKPIVWVLLKSILVFFLALIGYMFLAFGLSYLIVRYL
ncbi:DUF3667 domain-containing protein [Flavobacteriaceae bacterium TK19130]|nr:DUF3667 domain-containing protein [Thermobacterium salinum]